MAVYRLGIYAAIIAALQVTFVLDAPSCQAGDGPNRVTSSDVAAGQWIDSLLGPELAQTPKRQSNQRNTSRRSKRRRAALRAELVRNPDTGDGTPPFALVDSYGGVLRYVEPVKDVDLEAHLGDMVTVRRDTGDILLASQLALPGIPGIQLAQHEEPIPAGEVVGESSILTENPVFEGGDPHYGDPLYLDEGIDFGGCPQCGGGIGGCKSGCGYGARGVIYAHAEYALWWLEGMNTPELVTQLQNIDLTDPMNPVLVGPAEILYGGNRVLEDERHGGRITLGVWLDDYGQWGVEGDYLGLSEIDESFTAGLRDGQVPGIGNFIFRPFFNTATFTNINGIVITRGLALEDVDTNALDGAVTVNVRSEFQTAGIRLRHNLCCREGCCDPCCGDAVGCGSCVGCGSGVSQLGGPLGRLSNLLRKGTRHTDVLYGFRWASLDESLQVNEDLQQFLNIAVDPPTLGDKIDVQDRFVTENDFWGGEIGYETEWKLRRWSLNFLTKVAIGNTRQRVSISGFTDIDDDLTDAIPAERSTGGLLTQGFMHPGIDGIPGNEDDFFVGNIGNYERDEFSMIPEIGFTLGYNVTQRVKLTAGYTLLYWSNIVRPGDQISLDVNGELLQRNGVPNPANVVREDEPRFVFRQTDLWASGLNLGAEVTW